MEARDSMSEFPDVDFESSRVSAELLDQDLQRVEKVIYTVDTQRT